MGLVKGLPVGLSFIGPKWSEQLLLNLGYAYEQARGPFPTPKFYRAIEESPGSRRTSSRSGGKPQGRDGRDDGEDQKHADGARRFVEPQDADDDGADRSDPAPYRIGRPHRDRARRKLEQRHADRHRDEEGERPWQFRKPSTNRSEVVNPTSNSPPTISHSHGMTFLSLDERAHSLRSAS
jgi:hypothetical protein